jgi:hypothetical protein
MARPKISKSQRVRDYLTKHPEAGPTAVARALKRFGISVALVSAIRAKNQPARRRKRKAKVARRTAGGRRGRARGSNEIAPILAAADLIRACGGIEEAKSALETAGKIASALQ